MNKSTFQAMAAQYEVKEKAGEGIVSWEVGAHCVIPEVTIYGKAEQVTYSGKNLFDAANATKFSGACTITETTENGDITVSLPTKGTYRSANILLPTFPAGTELILSAKWTTSGSNRGALRFLWTAENGIVPSGFGSLSASGKTSSVVVPAHPEDAPYLCLGLYGNWSSGNSEAGDTVTYSEIMLAIGSEPTDYEPYTGGIPAPNPNYPIEPVFSSETRIKVTNDAGFDGGEAVAPELLAIPGTEYRDEWDPQTGRGVRRCARIDSYAGEVIDTPFVSSTGELTEGALVVYAIPDTPFQTDPQPLVQPKGTCHLIQTDGTLDDCPIAAKYVTHS